jgi:hypothetical protein
MGENKQVVIIINKIVNGAIIYFKIKKLIDTINNAKKKSYALFVSNTLKTNKTANNIKNNARNWKSNAKSAIKNSRDFNLFMNIRFFSV